MNLKQERRKAYLEFEQGVIEADDAFVLTRALPAEGIFQSRYDRPTHAGKHNIRVIILSLYDDDVKVTHIRVACYAYDSAGEVGQIIHKDSYDCIESAVRTMLLLTKERLAR